ncbi:hypothetical protein TNCV_4814561 [Trichonephila clavipes]|nr:hypothetical protein TNCV_4814561 [Trichonephila clavipes]
MLTLGCRATEEGRIYSKLKTTLKFDWILPVGPPTPAFRRLSEDKVHLPMSWRRGCPSKVIQTTLKSHLINGKRLRARQHQSRHGQVTFTPPITSHSCVYRIYTRLSSLDSPTALVRGDNRPARLIPTTKRHLHYLEIRNRIVTFLLRMCLCPDLSTLFFLQVVCSPDVR